MRRLAPVLTLLLALSLTAHAQSKLILTAPPPVHLNDTMVYAVFTLSLDQPSDVPVQAMLRVSMVNGVCYTGAGTTLRFATIPAGQLSLTVPFEVYPRDVYKDGVVLHVTAMPWPDTTAYEVSADAVIVDESPRPVISAPAELRAAEPHPYGATVVTIPLTSSRPLCGTVTVPTAPNADFALANGGAVFNGSTSRELQLNVLYNDAAPAPRTVTVPIVNGVPGVAADLPKPVQLTIYRPLSPLSLALPGGGGSGQLQVELGSVQPWPVTMLVTSSDSCVAVPPSVTILPGQLTTSIPVTVGPAPCFARVLVAFPPFLGGGTWSSDVASLSGLTLGNLSPFFGSASGGTAITLTGENFGPDCAVSFGRIPATEVHVANARLMTAVTPAHAPGIVDVTLTCGASSSTLSTAFVYVATEPAVTGVAPAEGSARGGTVVTISGHDFTAGCWPFFGGRAAHDATVVSPTSMIAATPAFAVAEGMPLEVRCSGAPPAVLRNAFTFTAADDPAPMITSIEPASAMPGDVITLHGSHFRFDDRIAFDAAASQKLETTPDTQLAVVPPLAAGRVSIQVTDVSGRLTTTGPIFDVLESTPRIDSIRPLAVPAGAEVIIEGSGFTTPDGFTLGGVRAALVSLSFHRAVIRVPALAPGPRALELVTRLNTGLTTGDAATPAGTIQVTDSGLLVRTAMPLCARSDGGSRLTILGNGFAPGATVTVGDVAASDVVVLDPTRITVTLPTLPPDRATIIVTNASGERATATDALAVFAPLDPDGCELNRRRAVR